MCSFVSPHWFYSSAKSTLIIFQVWVRKYQQFAIQQDILAEDTCAEISTHSSREHKHLNSDTLIKLMYLAKRALTHTHAIHSLVSVCKTATLSRHLEYRAVKRARAPRISRNRIVALAASPFIQCAPAESHIIESTLTNGGILCSSARLILALIISSGAARSRLLLHFRSHAIN